jgi:YidC/Oxa1 family membrane protein insertase
MTDQKNTILAIVLSALVLIVWQYFVGMPQMEKQRQEAQQKAQQQQQPSTVPTPQQQGQPGTVPVPGQPGVTPPPGQPTAPTAPGVQLSREAALAGSPRVKIETPRISGSVSLRGGRIDDISLTQYRETVDPKSPAIELLSPSGAPHPFYAQFGWSTATGAPAPASDALWRQEGSGALGVGRPLTLTHDNGEGLEFRRTITVDDKYLFTIRDQVTNKTAAPVTLYPYALISRHGTPKTEGFYIMHEGLIGVFAGEGLTEVGYSDIEKKKLMPFKSANAWLGITDKYWAATLIPDQKTTIQARFRSDQIGLLKTYQTDYLGDAQVVAPGASVTVETRLFAGAKETAIVDGYHTALGLDRFDKLIDWGYFHFITKPLFYAMDWLFVRTGNFGLAILIITLLIKIVFLPLANKSYASMAKMKAVQPEMMAIRERYADDKMKQQQALMELYKKEQINPLAGCLPILVQVPVFFALYKVLFITIEMRHAPFYGWIKDLSAPDPTNLFNLFGLIPWDPTLIPVLGQFLHVGIWPIVMGITMWFQMKLNPSPPDPTQKMIFDWMPLIFTFMLASFSAGLVIYWAWNNLLSVGQQSFIMHRHGAKIELWDNIKELFGVKKKDVGVKKS